MTPAIIKQFVIIYDNIMIVRIKATRSASASVVPAFSPMALAQSLQILVSAFNNVFITTTKFFFLNFFL